MKRYIASILAVLICVPLLSLTAYAEDLNMSEVVPDELLPHGYVYPRWSGFSLKVNRYIEYKDLMFYDSTFDMYFMISFMGTCTFVNSWSVGYTLKFSNPDSILMRAYPCNGRDVFTVTPEHQMIIQVPATEIGEATGGTITGEYIYSPDEFWYVQADGDNFRVYPQNREPQSGFTFTLPPSTMNIPAMNIPISVDELSSESLDYYIVQKSGSSVTTPIDHKLTWDYVSELRFGTISLRGYPVALGAFNVDAFATFFYEDGASYMLNTQIGHVQLRNVETLPTNIGLRLPISVLNRFLMHFGYDSVFYSGSNVDLSNDIGDIGAGMGEWADTTGDYADQAGTAVSGIVTTIGSFQPLFMGVWNVMPPWFFALLAVVLVIVIGRKILGR
jgi:hypothetical protein